MNLDQLTEAVLERLEQRKPRAYLIGQAPKDLHNFNYVNQEPYDEVVLGILQPGVLLHMPDNTVCQALLEGKPVWLWHEQLHHRPNQCRVLSRELSQAEAKLKHLGVQLLGKPEKLISADEARRMLIAGIKPQPGNRLTPLARDILEGKSP